MLRSSRRTKSPPSKWMQENLLLTVCRLEAWASWNDLYRSHEELQWIHKCCDLQCNNSVPVIYCFTSFRLYWYLLRATTHSLNCTHRCNHFRRQTFAAKKITYEKNIFLRKSRKSQMWQYLCSGHRDIVIVFRKKVKSIMPDEVPILLKTNMCLTNFSLGEWQLF